MLHRIKLLQGRLSWSSNTGYVRHHVKKILNHRNWIATLNKFVSLFIKNTKTYFTSTERAIFVWALFATELEICPFLDYHWIIGFVLHSILHTVHVFCSRGQINSWLVIWLRDFRHVDNSRKNYDSFLPKKLKNPISYIHRWRDWKKSKGWIYVEPLAVLKNDKIWNY